MSNSQTLKRTSYLRLIIGNILVICLILVVLEGVASYLLVFYEILMTHQVAERLHTRYDPQLGWANKPSVNMPDMYGPGISLKTNSQGFRADHDFDFSVPPGKYRIICSGDSFTLGYGVSNDRTWCQLLTLLDSHLETVNMGQGGYGVDQAYLWYKRDALKFEHQAHLLAFITEDFQRMRSDEFLGYGKPVIDIENDSLVVKNVPVPSRAYRIPWLTSNCETLKHLRTIDFLMRLLLRLGVAPRSAPQVSSEEKGQKTRQVLEKIFKDLKLRDDAQSCRLVLVYLPQRTELKGEGPKEWIEFIERESQSLGVPLINVLDTFRGLTDAEAAEMFIQEGQLAYPAAAGHLSNQGNQLVADLIYKALKKDLMAQSKGGHR